MSNPPTAPNLWRVQCRVTNTLGHTPNPCDYNYDRYIPNGTTTQKDTWVRAFATFDAGRIRSTSGLTWSILSSTERNDLKPVGWDTF